MITGHIFEKAINGPAHHTLHHIYFTVNYGQVSSSVFSLFAWRSPTKPTRSTSPGQTVSVAPTANHNRSWTLSSRSRRCLLKKSKKSRLGLNMHPMRCFMMYEYTTVEWVIDRLAASTKTLLINYLLYINGREELIQSHRFFVIWMLALRTSDYVVSGSEDFWIIKLECVATNRAREVLTSETSICSVCISSRPFVVHL